MSFVNPYDVRPTYGGLKIFEELCAAAGFPLPELRLEICTTKWVTGSISSEDPPLHEGDLADLRALAKDYPCGMPVNFVLQNLPKGYGVRFLETRTTIPPLMGPEFQNQYRSYGTVAMEPYGGPFADFVERRRKEFANIVRYGKIPELRDRFALHFGVYRHPERTIPVPVLAIR